ncbi:MAG: DNA-binding protein [Candidatus Nitrosocaldus sp.]
MRVREGGWIRTMAQYDNRSEEEKAREMEIRLMRERLLRALLTSEARQRLTNLKMVKPDLAKAVEDYIITMGSQGRISRALTDEELKRLLLQIQQPKREFRINYK